MPRLRFAQVLLMVVVAIAFTERAYGLRIVTEMTKDELQLKYDVVVTEHSGGKGTVRVMITLADEGKLKPLHNVTLEVRDHKRDGKGGSSWVELQVPIQSTTNNKGELVFSAIIPREMAERSEIQFRSFTIDGKPLARDVVCHHVIPIAEHLKTSPALSIPTRAVAE